ncbi:MAG: LysM peptidoglycan-binding domain-containing protein [Ktedonobacterales bacterium]
MGIRMPNAAALAEREKLDGNPGNRSAGWMRGTTEVRTMASTWCEQRSASESAADEYGDLYATLHMPEQEQSLDFSGVFAAVQQPRQAVARRDIGALSPARRTPARAQTPSAKPAVGRRVAQVSRRLVEIGAMRPQVVIPVRSRTQGTHASQRTTLPPVWLLANILILLVTGIAVLPHIVPVDAASACKWHTVVPGDTLGNLGHANHTNALALARANHIQNPDLIFVGQRLCIPMTDWAQAKNAPNVPSVQQPPTYGSASNVKSFVQLALPYARQAHQQTGWPTSLILAQWGLEHGWHVPSHTGYNWGNVAALPGEPTVNGIAVPGSPAAFAYASTPQDGTRIYVRVARLGYYSAVAPAAASGGVDAAARALGRSPWDAGHYTDHRDPGSSLLSILHVYNLYWYDTH